MAKETKTAEIPGTQTGVMQEPQKEKMPPAASVYPVGELATNAKKLFGSKQECVVAALKAAGKTECTVAEAKKIVEKFLKREVK